MVFSKLLLQYNEKTESGPCNVSDSGLYMTTEGVDISGRDGALQDGVSVIEGLLPLHLASQAGAHEVIEMLLAASTAEMRLRYNAHRQHAIESESTQAEPNSE